VTVTSQIEVDISVDIP